MKDNKEIDIFRDRHLIVVQTEQTGKPPKIETYLTVRGGISWPSIDSPGYFCLLGMKDEHTLTERKPLELLTEGKASLIDKFSEKLSLSATRWCCDPLIADCSEGNKGFQDSLDRFVRDRKVKDIRLWDSSEFSMSIKYSVGLIRQWREDNALCIPKGTILNEQLTTVTTNTPERELEKMYFAIMALCRVLASFEVYPWRKCSGKTAGFTNWDNRRKQKSSGNSGYFECFVD
jgi:hypothetical protein